MTSEIVKYSIGSEVEHTPAFSKKTLFVEGFPSSTVASRIASEKKVQHIRLSANSADDNWNEIIVTLLDLGYFVTLEFHSQYQERFQSELSKGVWQSRQFVPLVKVELHNLATLGTNLSIKFESQTNDGVWTWNQHELMDNNKVTLWHDYDARLDYDPCPPTVAVRPRPVVEEVVKLEPDPPTEELYFKAADFVENIVPDISSTTSGSIDSADTDTEPDLVARKTVKEAQAKQKAELQSQGKIVKKAK